MSGRFALALPVLALAAGQPVPPQGGYERVRAHEARAAEHEAKRELQPAILAHGEAIAEAEALGRPALLAVLHVRLGLALERVDRVQDAVYAHEAGLRVLAGGSPGNAAAKIVELLRRDLEGGVKSVVSTPAGAPADLYPEPPLADLDAAQADPALLVRLLVNLANAYARMPQDEVALSRYRKALAQPAATGLLRAHALVNVAEVERRRGRDANAAAALAEAWPILEAQGSAREHRRVLLVLAALEMNAGRPAEAERRYREAIARYREAHDARGEGRAEAGLGGAQLAQGKSKDARESFGRARAIARAEVDGDTTWRAAWGLGRACRMLGDLDCALQAYGEAADAIGTWRGGLATDEGKLAFVDGARAVLDQAVEVAFERSRACADADRCAEVLATVERSRGRALADLMACAVGPRDRRPGEPGPTCQALAPWGVGEMAYGLEMAANTPVQMALGAYGGGGGMPCPPPPLPPRGTAAGTAGPARLAFHVLQDRTLALVVDARGTVRGLALPLGRAQIEDRVHALRSALGVLVGARGGLADPGGAAPPVETTLRELARDLLDPVLQWLPPRGELLVLEPSDALWLLPFAALRLEDGTWAGDHWPIAYTPSADALLAARARPAPGKDPPSERAALVVASGDRPVSLHVRGQRFEFGPIPGVVEEARFVGGKFKGARVLGPGSASVEALLAEIESKDVVHLATHGVALAERPLDSFLVLEPAPACAPALTARQVTALKLRADLVVLSACQTGLGRVSAEGMVGLARAFLAAGARTAVVSQWNVSDRATVELMKAFYEGYLAGLEKPVALQRAAMKVRAMPGLASPRYWAPFMMVGAER